MLLRAALLVAVCGTICEMVYGGDLEAEEIKRMAEAKAHGGALELPSPLQLQHSGDGKDFGSSFTASFVMILACEVGDKTFFIAMILALRNGRAVIFSGAILALAVMTVMGVGLGWVLPLLMPVIYTHYASVVLFFYFGFVLLKEAYESDGDEGFEELEEVEAELAKKDDDHDPESQNAKQKSGFVNLLEALFTPVLIKAFTMTFVAEWGDRSQIATIALAAQKEPFGVIFGGIAGHCVCTGCAVMFGQMISTRISERSVALVGGVVFMGFGVYNLVVGPDDVDTMMETATAGDTTAGEFLQPPSIPDRRLQVY